LDRVSGEKFSGFPKSFRDKTCMALANVWTLDKFLGYKWSGVSDVFDRTLTNVLDRV
jgi:hypothetical protein